MKTFEEYTAEATGPSAGWLKLERDADVYLKNLLALEKQWRVLQKSIETNVGDNIVARQSRQSVHDIFLHDIIQADMAIDEHAKIALVIGKNIKEYKGMI